MNLSSDFAMYKSLEIIVTLIAVHVCTLCLLIDIPSFLQFPSFIHTQKRNPATHLKDPDMFWDFLTLRPESLHQVSILFSDRGTPYGYRHMNGYGSHTYKLVNAEGNPVYCKFHFKVSRTYFKNSLVSQMSCCETSHCEHPDLVV